MSNETTTTQTTSLTPYAAHKYVNGKLEEAGLSKRIPPQMMYNYTSGRLNKGKDPFIAYTDKTGVDQEALEEWTDAYVAKQVAKANKVEEDETTEAE